MVGDVFLEVISCLDMKDMAFAILLCQSKLEDGLVFRRQRDALGCCYLAKVSREVPRMLSTEKSRSASCFQKGGLCYSVTGSGSQETPRDKGH